MILAGHLQSTRSRFAATTGPILVLQDTTEFTYQRERAESDRRMAPAELWQGQIWRSQACARCAGC